MDWVQLDTLCTDLLSATKTFKDVYNTTTGSLATRKESLADGRFSAFSDAGDEVSAARKHLCGILTRMQTFFASPGYLVHQLSTQTQLLACLKWIGDFQVIAYVPLSGSVSIEELAELADAPRFILSRIVRVTATAGFLCESEPDYVAHTPLSASFSTELSYLDAAMFLSNHIAPSALHLSAVTQKQDGMPPPAASWNDIGSAFMLALNSPETFASACAGQPQLNRQWSAYCQSLGGLDDTLASLLGQLNRQNLGEASIVYVCSKYTASSKKLFQNSRALRVVVQTYEFTPPDAHTENLGPDQSMSRRIAVQWRKPTEPQPVKDAAVYILQPPLSPMATDGTTVSHEHLIAELQSHIEVLQANPSALLLFAPTLLPEPGSVAVNVEIEARLRDLAQMQLSSETALEVAELVMLFEDVNDRHGRPMMMNRIRSHNGATIALAVKSRPYSAGDIHTTKGDVAMNSDS